MRKWKDIEGACCSEVTWSKGPKKHLFVMCIPVIN